MRETYYISRGKHYILIKKIDEQNENRKLQEIDTYNYEGKLQRMAALVKEFCQMDFWIAFSELYEYKSNKYKTLTEYIFA